MIKNSVLITGIVGVGKSSICAELIKRGYEAYDLDMLADIHVPPKIIDESQALQIVGNYHKIDEDDEEEEYNAHDEITKAYNWIYDRERLADLIIEQNNILGYYFGVSANINELLPYFSMIILLEMPAKALQERLAGTIQMTEEEYANLAPSWQHDWENFVAANNGTTIVDATRSLSVIADEIIRLSLTI